MKLLIIVFLLIPVLTFSQTIPDSYKKKATEFLFKKRELRDSDTLYIDKKNMAIFVKFATLDSCEKIELFTINAAQIHSKMYLCIMSKSDLEIIDSEDISVIINAMNKYILTSTCPMNNQDKMIFFDYLLKYAKSQRNYSAPRKR